MTRIVIITLDRYLWCLRPFSWCLKKHWPDHPPVLVGTDVMPKFVLPNGFQFVTISRFTEDAQDWGDRLVVLLNGIDDEFVNLMLEDFFLIKPVNTGQVTELERFTQARVDIGRMCLTDECMERERSDPYPDFTPFPLLQRRRSSPYYIGQQASIWRRQALIEATPSGSSPWDFQSQMASPWHEKWSVFGPAHNLMCYIRAVLSQYPRTIIYEDWDGGGNQKMLDPRIIKQWKKNRLIPSDIRLQQLGQGR